MRELAIEIGVRALLFGVFVFTEFLDPFQRVIQPEEIWLYKNPLVQSDNVPTRLMFAISFLTPLAVICVVKIIRRTDKTEIKEAFLDKLSSGETKQDKLFNPKRPCTERSCIFRGSPLPLSLVLNVKSVSAWRSVLLRRVLASSWL
nr:phospholipid phosphatase 4 isoform X1 [Manis javanica]